MAIPICASKSTFLHVKSLFALVIDAKAKRIQLRQGINHAKLGIAKLERLVLVQNIVQQKNQKKVQRDVQTGVQRDVQEVGVQKNVQTGVQGNVQRVDVQVDVQVGVQRDVQRDVQEAGVQEAYMFRKVDEDIRLAGKAINVRDGK